VGVQPTGQELGEDQFRPKSTVEVHYVAIGVGDY